MSTVKVDLIDGSAKYTREGWEFQRKAIVYDLATTGEGAISAHSRIAVAYTHLVAAHPDCLVGQRHPSGVRSYLEEANLNAVDQDKVTFDLAYKPPEPNEFLEGEQDEVEIGSSITQIETKKDATGALMIVEYGSPAHQQAVTVNKSAPQTTISITRRENGSPGVKSRNYVGKVNTSGWAKDPGAQARTWMCTSIVGRNTGGNVYEVNYQFQYRPETWDHTEVYIDPETGRPPYDVVDGTGLKTFVIYQTANFNALSL
jgi:hypothetical protein